MPETPPELDVSLYSGDPALRAVVQDGIPLAERDAEVRQASRGRTESSNPAKDPSDKTPGKMEMEVELPPGGDDEKFNWSGTHSMWSAVFNFVNSIVGAGIIGLAFAMEEGGYFLSILLLLGCGVLTDVSVRLIVDIGTSVGKDSYEELCSHLLGRGGFLAVSFSMLLFAYGAMISYLIIIGDTVSPVLESWTGSGFLGNRTFIISVCACTICLPLSCLRDIGKLAKTSAVSIGAVFLIVLLVVVRSPAASQQLGIHDNDMIGWVGGGVGAHPVMNGSSMAVASPSCAPILPLVGVGHSLAPSAASPGLTEAASVFDGPYSASLNLTLSAQGTVHLMYAMGRAAIPSSCRLAKDGMHHDLTHGSLPLALTPGSTWRVDVHRHRKPRVVEGGRVAGNESEVQISFGLREQWKQREDGLAFAHKNFFPAFGAIAFAYVCHHSSFLVRNSLKDPTEWTKVTRISVGMATFLSIALCSFGYLFFQRCTRPDILNNFAGDDQTINVTRLMLALTMFFTFPMEFFVVRQAAGSLFLKPSEGERPSLRTHYVMSAIIFAFVLPPGLLLDADKLGLVLEFSGGFAAALLGFILPALLWYGYVRTLPPTVGADLLSLPSPVDRDYVAYNSPSTAEKSRAWKEVAWTGWRSSWGPFALLVVGSMSLLANTILAGLHAAGVDQYSYPSFCPRL